MLKYNIKSCAAHKQKMETQFSHLFCKAKVATWNQDLLEWMKINLVRFFKSISTVWSIIENKLLPMRNISDYWPPRREINTTRSGYIHFFAVIILWGCLKNCIYHSAERISSCLSFSDWRISQQCFPYSAFHLNNRRLKFPRESYYADASPWIHIKFPFLIWKAIWRKITYIFEKRRAWSNVYVISLLKGQGFS